MSHDETLPDGRNEDGRERRGEKPLGGCRCSHSCGNCRRNPEHSEFLEFLELLEHPERQEDNSR